MCIEVIVCYISVVFLRHIVSLPKSLSSGINDDITTHYTKGEDQLADCFTRLLFTVLRLNRVLNIDDVLYICKRPNVTSRVRQSQANFVKKITWVLVSAG